MKRVSANVSSARPLEVHRFINPSVLATAYVFVGFALCLVVPSDAVFFVLFTHTRIWSAYLHHEAAHQTITRSPALDAAIGRMLQWVNGSSYFPYTELVDMHKTHHITKVDYAVVLTTWEERWAVTRLVLSGLEYCYVPGHFYLLKLRAVTSPWWEVQRRSLRLRTAVVVLVRGAMYGWLATRFGALRICLAFVGVSVAVHALRFTDTFSHTYEKVPVGTVVSAKTQSYDQVRTHSLLMPDLLSALLFLHFPYHNAHHLNTLRAWYELPRIHDDLVHNKWARLLPEQSVERCCIPWWDAALQYHKHRVSRMYLPLGAPRLSEDEQGRRVVDITNFVGEKDASFLVPEFVTTTA